MTEHLHPSRRLAGSPWEALSKILYCRPGGTGAITSLLWLIIRQNQLSIEGLVKPLP